MPTTSSRNRFLLLGAIAVVAVSTIIYVFQERAAVVAVYDRLEAQVMLLEDGYTKIATDSAQPLYSDRNSAFFDAMNTALANVATHEGTLGQRMEKVRDLMVALHALVPRLSIETNERAKAFAEEIGDKGEIKKDLQTYNDLAKGWRNTSHVGWRGFFGGNYEEHVGTLPSLRFTGEDERGNVGI